MTPFGPFQPVVFAFAAGLALVWTAAIVLRLRRDERSLGWELFAVFAAAQAVAEWIGLATAAEPNPATVWLQLGFSTAAFLALIEFGRRELRGKHPMLQKPWVYALLVAAAAFKTAVKGSEGLEAVCCYVFAPLGGLLAAVALAQRVRIRRDAGWGLPLAAAAIAFFAVGYAFSIDALQAFAGLGLLLGVWRESRDKTPLPKQAGAIVRWRWPAAFVVLALAGSAALIAREYAEQDASAVVVVRGASEAGNANAASSVELDSRQLSRERAAAQRNKQALMLLIVVVVVAAVWIGLSRLSRR
jgi:hypothetical protein